MAKCTFENLTPEQAKTLGEWFQGEGESSCQFWFEANCEDPAPLAKAGPDAVQQDEDGNVTVQTRTP